jgi:hypothetical protein
VTNLNFPIALYLAALNAQIFTHRKIKEICIINLPQVMLVCTSSGTDLKIEHISEQKQRKAGTVAMTEYIL